MTELALQHYPSPSAGILFAIGLDVLGL